MNASQARLLFQQCCDRLDKQRHQLLSRDDLRKLRDMPSGPLESFSPEEVTEIFELLDRNLDGEISELEFVQGFIDFFEYQHQPAITSTTSSPIADPTEMIQRLSVLLECEESLVARIYDRSPIPMRNKLISLFSAMDREIDRKSTGLKLLEESLTKNITEQHEEVQRLYNELDAKVVGHREEILLKEREHDRDSIERFQQAIADKKLLIDELMAKQKKVQEEIHTLEQNQNNSMQEITLLMGQREKLENELDEVELILEDSRSTLSELSKEKASRREKNDQKSTFLRHNITAEHQALLDQVDQLRKENQRLRDQQDETNLEFATMNDIEFKFHEVEDDPYEVVDDDEAMSSQLLCVTQQPTNCYSPISLTGSSSPNIYQRKPEPLSQATLVARLSDQAPVAMQGLQEEEADNDEDQDEQDQFAGEPNAVYKVMLLGDPGRAMNEFQKEFFSDPRQQLRTKMVTINGEMHMIQIWNFHNKAAGDEMARRQVPRFDAFLIVCDEQTRPCEARWRQWVERNWYYSHQKPCILVLDTDLAGKQLEELLDDGARLKTESQFQSALVQFTMRIQENEREGLERIRDPQFIEQYRLQYELEQQDELRRRQKEKMSLFSYCCTCCCC